MMKDFDEKTIWTSDVIPLMASYHKGFVSHFSNLAFPFFVVFKKFICGVQGSFSTLSGKSMA